MSHDLTHIADQATTKVRQWLTTSAQHTITEPGAARLAAVLSDPNGLEFTVGFVDRVIRTDDRRAAAHALAELGNITPQTLSHLDRAQINAGSLLAPTLPNIVVPAASTRIRQMVGHMIVDARERHLDRAISSLTKQGNRLNINLLGEAVLGEEQATIHLDETRRLLSRDDVDYVSIKVSSIASQISMWGFDQTVQYVTERLTPLYLEASRAPAGTKFINLDMEEYRDLRLTVEIFRRLLSTPETKNLEAGIVLQAYLPDALGAMQELAEFANQRVTDGGAGIKVRLVKGANLSMERVHAEIAGWPLTTCPTKTDTDANYKLVLHWLLNPENMRGLRIGVAGHNLFDIAFAHLLGTERGVTDRMEFEMLQGMASSQVETIGNDLGRPLLYVPAVRPEEFDAAISYLVRRLEENAATENFMSGIFDITPDNPTFQREEKRFRESLSALQHILNTRGHTPPPPNDQQNRATEQLPDPRPTAELLPPFTNEPDTNPALPGNQTWARETIQRATPEWLNQQTTPAPLHLNDVDDLVETTRKAAHEWAARPALERAHILYRAADILAHRRSHLISLAAAEAGKTIGQSDPEISEAIDFARYYAHSALELEGITDATFTPDRAVLITPPWNFPIAIPAGSTIAALAAGAGVIHKPSAPTPHCSAAIVEALWDAGVPRDLLHVIAPDEGDVGRALVTHPGIDRIILTGAYETAAMFSSWRPGLTINAETSGKNAIIITPSADRDLATADLVNSAFGHAGQKCSAASLAICVGSVYNSERFRRQLVDAASSLIVDLPHNLSATVGPLTENPSDKLHRALTTLEPGETWLLKPRQLDDTGRLWSPGIKDGVKPGSFFHHTEVFGPVLGLMHAENLNHAIALQNDVDYGLTGGIHSLDADEVRTWLDQVQVGNAYVNRGITGAIVQRQSFGGWKKSSVGLGSKAGGPNYVMLMGTWHDTDTTSSTPTSPAPVVTQLATAAQLDENDTAWLAAAAASDSRAWEKEFSTPRDRTGLTSEANLFRYRRADVALRISQDAPAREIARAALAAHTTGARVLIAAHPQVSSTVKNLLEHIEQTLPTPPVRWLDDTGFADALANTSLDSGIGARVRIIGSLPDLVTERLASRPSVALLADPITASGRVELRNWVKEQSLSITLHRFGNASGPFHALSAELSTPSKK
ncbi:proline dehydrogenase family protein [Dermatophilus congolensis]|uniref:proline dehydrogenase family protein n=1 Tax=Dermatophilus congolensis TaxID=1863 RepID=UPI001AAE6E9F|nr:proline dehydrogenase family protein [Dermatophilus congolensis]MBO3173286.1 aldehyde dehydrogenase family protein [Dermatophilus congolensis]MBO3193582.1 aldehyde dehydrogenase family protein [Dermatophilus congolensis]